MSTGGEAGGKGRLGHDKGLRSGFGHVPLAFPGKTSSEVSRASLFSAGSMLPP